MSAEQHAIEACLEDAVAMGVTPAVAFGVSRGGDALKTWCRGRHTPDPASQACGPNSLFDLASLTKPLTTTLWFLRQVEAGRVSLDTPLSEVLPIRSDALGACPIWRLLSHTSGLPAHHHYYRDLGPTALRTGDHTEAKASIRRTVANTPPEGAPGDREIYSDLGYMLLEWLTETLDQPLVDAAGQLPHHGDGALHFRPVPAGDGRSYAATELCPWRQRMMQGEVHDDNCWTMGGVAGHAGLFGALVQVHELSRQWLEALGGRNNELGLSADLVEGIFHARFSHPTGTRALGWDTPTAGHSTSGRHFGPRSIGHLGFTGTSVWIDADAEVIMVLLTNRVCPSRDHFGIRALRPAIHDLGWEWLNGCST